MDSTAPDIKKNYEICEDDYNAFALPILRADDKVYLEGLQRGELFMRNALYYQADEEKDPRNDIYDSAVPAGDMFRIHNNPEIGTLSNGRLTGFGWYIKCFYQFKPSDIHRKNDGSYCLRMSDESKKWFSEMDKEHVIIIIDTREFMRRFYAYCDSSGLRHLADAVHYLDDTEYIEYCREYSCAMQNVATGRDFNRKLIPFTLCKRKKFSTQQEIRVCVHYSDISNNLLKKYGSIANLSYQELETIRNKTTTEIIGSLADISVICTLKELFELEIPVTLRN